MKTQLAEAAKRAEKNAQQHERAMQELHENLEKKEAAVAATVSALERKVETVQAEKEKLAAVRSLIAHERYKHGLTSAPQEVHNLKLREEQAKESLKDNDAYTEDLFAQLQREQTAHAHVRDELSKLTQQHDTLQSVLAGHQMKLKEAKEEIVSVQKVAEAAHKEQAKMSAYSLLLSRTAAFLALPFLRCGSSPKFTRSHSISSPRSRGPPP